MKIGAWAIATAILLGLFAPAAAGAEELPRPSYSNSLIVSLEHSPTDSAEVDYIKANLPFGLYAWLSFSVTHLDPDLAWHHDWSDASNGIQAFKDAVDSYIAACQAKAVRLHLVLCSGLARGLQIYNEAKQEDIRNAQWYNDGNIASDGQITNPAVLDMYVFGSLSRYARKVRANLEAKSRAALAFLKQKMTDDPATLTALSGWGEAELNKGRLDSSVSLQEYFCDYSPFAVMEFRDWVQHAGMYDDASGAYKGQGWSGGGAKYQGTSGLAQFNADIGTSFTTWDLKYFNWSLADDYDTNPVDDVNNDPHRIPYVSYVQGGMMPSSGAGFIAGGFDPPRTMQPGNAFYDLWHAFRETMVHNFIHDAAGWAEESGISPSRWFSHQIPGDYLFGTNPSTPNKNGRYYSSASALWGSDIKPEGSPGATIYDIKFPEWFSRTSEYAVPAMAALGSNWAILEYDAETYPVGYSVPQSEAASILEQYERVYSYSPHLLNFWRWTDGSLEHQIKGMNKEAALQDFIRRVRDKARRPTTTFFTPPEVSGLSGAYLPGSGKIRLELTGKIWQDLAWTWKEWGDFDRFEIYRGTAPHVPADAGHKLSETEAYFYEDGAVVPGTAYFYRWRAVNSQDSAGPLSDEVMVVPSTTDVPVLYVDKTKLVFGATAGAAATSSQKLVVTNLGPAGTTIHWTASPSQAWIVVTPSSGTGSATVGVGVNHAGLSQGSYSGTVAFSDPGAFNSPQTVEVVLTVYPSGGDAAPLGYFDTPVGGSTVSGSIAVTGWAVDDVEVTKVEVKRDPDPDDPAGAIGADGKVYIGDAVFVKGARPDVEAIYPNYPLADRAGWGYMMLTYGLPRQGNGTFNLYAYAHDGSGHLTELGHKTITSDNAHRTKPFGTIDTPNQGATISGNPYVSFGWALTPPPAEIPRDGSTIWLSIDGVFLGHPVYNQYRVDVAESFPGYLNSDGAVGYYFLNTTEFVNGVHTIGWLVTDNAGQADGMGSRFIEVQNLEGAAWPGFDAARTVEDGSGSLGIEIEGPPEIEVQELKRIVIKLKARGGRRIIGWGADKTKSLPAGSNLDGEKGVFTWALGPGFLGRHVLHFAAAEGNLRSPAATLIVNIVPRRYGRGRPDPAVVRSTIRE